MSKISEEEILKHISNGVDGLMQDRADALWETPAEPTKGTEWYLEGEKKPRRTAPKRRYMGAAAACLLLCLFSSLLFTTVPSAAVYLDVNPSISLSVNYRNRVTGVTACNEDAEVILRDLDFRGTDLDVALYAILGSMVHNGYLTEEQDSILVSVSCANESRAAQLEKNVSNMVTDSLKDMINAGEVLSHQVTPQDEAGNSPVTPGKTAFIRDLEERYPQLKEDDLEELTVDEIVTILKEERLDYSDYTDDEFDDDDDDDDDLDDEDDDDDDDDDDGGDD